MEFIVTAIGIFDIDGEKKFTLQLKTESGYTIRAIVPTNITGDLAPHIGQIFEFNKK